MPSSAGRGRYTVQALVKPPSRRLGSLEATPTATPTHQTRRASAWRRRGGSFSEPAGGTEQNTLKKASNTHVNFTVQEIAHPYMGRGGVVGGASPAGTGGCTAADWSAAGAPDLEGAGGGAGSG